MARLSSRAARWARAGFLKIDRRLSALTGLAVLLTPLATPAFAQTVNYYAGTDSAGMSVGIYTTATAQGEVIYSFSIGGNRYCGGVQIQGATLGGNTDGSEFYPVIDGRATFSELRPDFFIAADIRFLGKGRVTGTAMFQQAIYTGRNFPPRDRDAVSCTTRELTFSAAYVGSDVTRAPALRPVAPQAK